MIYVNPTISIVTLNVNVLYMQVKKTGILNVDLKRTCTACWQQETTLHLKIQVKWLEKNIIYQH